MKLILTHEVTGLGAPGDIVEVKDGYGRNYLIPRGFAIRWTRAARSRSTRSRTPAARERSATSTRPRRSRRRSRARPVDVPVRAGEGGRLFGAVTVSDIAAAINKKAGGSSDVVDKRKILVGNPIKSLGRPPGHREGPRRARGHRPAARRPRLTVSHTHDAHGTQAAPVSAGGSLRSGGARQASRVAWTPGATMPTRSSTGIDATGSIRVT